MAKDLSLPPEIWMMIMEHCSVLSLLALARVSPCCHDLVRTRLLRAISFEEPPPNFWKRKCFLSHNPKDLPEEKEEELRGSKSPIVVQKPELFLEMLKSSDINWRAMIRSATIDWTWDVDTFGEESMWSKDHEAFKIASLLSECTRLVHFGMTLPITNLISSRCSLPHITSLEVTLLRSVPSRDIDTPDFSWEEVLEIFQVPSLKILVLRQLDFLCFTRHLPFPPKLQQVGFSNVSELYLHDCEPYTTELSAMVKWTKNLKILEYNMGEEGLKNWEMEREIHNDLSHQVNKIIGDLRSARDSLEELSLDLGFPWFLACRFETGHLLKSFERLRKLKVPAEFLLFSKRQWLPENLQTLNLTAYCEPGDDYWKSCLLGVSTPCLFEMVAGLRNLNAGLRNFSLKILCCSIFKHCPHVKAALTALSNNGISIDRNLIERTVITGGYSWR